MRKAASRVADLAKRRRSLALKPLHTAGSSLVATLNRLEKANVPLLATAATAVLLVASGTRAAVEEAEVLHAQEEDGSCSLVEEKRTLRLGLPGFHPRRCGGIRLDTFDITEFPSVIAPPIEKPGAAEEECLCDECDCHQASVWVADMGA